MFALLRILIVAGGIAVTGPGAIVGVVLGLCALGGFVGLFQEKDDVLIQASTVTPSGLTLTVSNPHKQGMNISGVAKLACEWQGPVYRDGVLFGVHKVTARFHSPDLPLTVRAGRTKTLAFVVPTSDRWPPPLEGTEKVKCDFVGSYPETIGETWVSRADHCTINCPPFLIRRSVQS